MQKDANKLKPWIDVLHEENAHCWVTLTFLSSGIGWAIMLVTALVIALVIALVLLCNCVEIREQTIVLD